MEQCIGCHQPIAERFLLRIMNDYWHEGCVACSACNGPLQTSCYVREGRLYCKYDYMKIFGIRCGGCCQPVLPSDLIFRSLHIVYHLQCFCCTFCGNQLRKGDHYVVREGGQIICRYDYERELALLSSSTPQSDCDDCDYEDMDDSDSDNGKCCKRPRTILTTNQRRRFKSAFEINPKPSRKIRENLAAETGLSVRVIQVWFQNQRAKVKKLARRQTQELQNNNRVKGDTDSGSRVSDESRDNSVKKHLLDRPESIIPLPMTNEDAGDPIDKLYSMQETYFT